MFRLLYLFIFTNEQDVSIGCTKGNSRRQLLSNLNKFASYLTSVWSTKTQK